jgi:hypothetical protein
MTRAFAACLLFAAAALVPSTAVAQQPVPPTVLKGRDVVVLGVEGSDARLVREQCRACSRASAGVFGVVSSQIRSLLQRPTTWRPTPRAPSEHRGGARSVFFFGRRIRVNNRDETPRSGPSMRVQGTWRAGSHRACPALVLPPRWSARHPASAGWQSRVQIEVHTKILDRLQSTRTRWPNPLKPSGSTSSSGPEPAVPEPRTTAARSDPLVGAGRRMLMALGLGFGWCSGTPLRRISHRRSGDGPVAFVLGVGASVSGAGYAVGVLGCQASKE